MNQLQIHSRSLSSLLYELSEHIDPKLTIDLLAIALRISPARKITTCNGEATIQDSLFVTEELKPISLTMWDQFTEHEGMAITEIIHAFPILIGTHIRVSDFNGPTPSTESSSCFTLNPDTPEATALSLWRTKHMDELQSLLQTAPSTLGSRTKIASPRETLTSKTANHSETMSSG